MDIIFVGVGVSLLLLRDLAYENLVVFENGWQMNFGDLVSGDIWGGTVESSIDIEIRVVDPTCCSESLKGLEPIPFRILSVINLHTQLLVDRVGPPTDDK